MSKKTKPRKKHIPQRTCIGCQSVQPKRTMIRIVRTSEGVQIDPSGKMSGRGAYLHENRSCWEAGLKNSIARALKTELSTEDRIRLSAYVESLPAEETIRSQDES